MNIKNFKITLPFAIGLGVLLFLFVFLITSTWIGYGVRERCENAQAKYGGECIRILLSNIVLHMLSRSPDRWYTFWLGPEIM